MVQAHEESGTNSISKADRKSPSAAHRRNIPERVDPAAFSSFAAKLLSSQGASATHRVPREYSDPLAFPPTPSPRVHAVKQVARSVAPSARRAPPVAHTACATAGPPRQARRDRARPSIFLLRSNPESSAPVSAIESRLPPSCDLSRSAPPLLPASHGTRTSAVQTRAPVQSHSNPRAVCSRPGSSPAPTHLGPGAQLPGRSSIQQVVPPAT